MRQSDYTKHRALSRHESYVKQKAKWRDKAIEWQAGMYGLLVEFRENGIC